MRNHFINLIVLYKFFFFSHLHSPLRCHMKQIRTIRGDFNSVYHREVNGLSARKLEIYLYLCHFGQVTHLFTDSLLCCLILYTIVVLFPNHLVY